MISITHLRLSSLLLLLRSPHSDITSLQKDETGHFTEDEGEPLTVWILSKQHINFCSQSTQQQDDDDDENLTVVDTEEDCIVMMTNDDNNESDNENGADH